MNIWTLIVRSLLTAAIFGIFWWLVGLIIFEEITGTARDLLFIVLGSFLTAFGKVVDYWFTKRSNQ